MGDALEKRSTNLLAFGAPYNEECGSDMIKDRFDVSSHNVLKDTFQILDRVCCIVVNIACEHLEDPGFNLIHWYGVEIE